MNLIAYLPGDLQDRPSNVRRDRLRAGVRCERRMIVVSGTIGKILGLPDGDAAFLNLHRREENIGTGPRVAQRGGEQGEREAQAFIISANPC